MTAIIYEIEKEEVKYDYFEPGLFFDREGCTIYESKYFKIIYPDGKKSIHEYHKRQHGHYHSDTGRVKMNPYVFEDTYTVSEPRSLVLQKTINELEAKGFYARPDQISYFLNGRIDQLIMQKRNQNQKTKKNKSSKQLKKN